MNTPEQRERLEVEHRPREIEERLDNRKDRSYLRDATFRLGLETLLTGGVAAVLAYLVGSWLRRTFGVMQRGQDEG